MPLATSGLDMQQQPACVQQHVAFQQPPASQQPDTPTWDWTIVPTSWKNVSSAAHSATSSAPTMSEEDKLLCIFKLTKKEITFKHHKWELLDQEEAAWDTQLKSLDSREQNLMAELNKSEKHRQHTCCEQKRQQELEVALKALHTKGLTLKRLP